jgi:hypothetical protein
MNPLGPRAVGGMPQVDVARDRRSWGIVDGRRSTEEPVDRARPMENANRAFPTARWTAHRTRRPQRPTGALGFTEEEQMRKMTRLAQGGARH